MGAVDSPQPKERKGKKGKRKRHRLGVKVDMTPMVDVAFLLLIFYMVTTVFKTPKAIEINVPPKDAEKNEIKIAESKLVSLLVSADNKVYYRVGTDKPVLSADSKALLKFLESKGKELYNPVKKESDLNVAIKVDKEARFHNLVDLIDALSLAKITRFGFAPYTDADKAALAQVGG